MIMVVARAEQMLAVRHGGLPQFFRPLETLLR